jgi:hypothetical protein
VVVSIFVILNIAQAHFSECTPLAFAGRLTPQHRGHQIPTLPTCPVTIRFDSGCTSGRSMARFNPSAKTPGRHCFFDFIEEYETQLDLILRQQSMRFGPEANRFAIS